MSGAAALVLQLTPSATPAAVSTTLTSSATTGVVTNPGPSSPNRLLYSLGSYDPPPPPRPPGCGTLPQVATGTLSGTGDDDFHPNGTYYSGVSGTHRGCLDGPAGVDFDLYLWKWNGSAWSTVAQSTSSAPDETITYTGAPGYYLWRVLSYTSSGSYTIGSAQP